MSYTFLSWTHLSTLASLMYVCNLNCNYYTAKFNTRVVVFYVLVKLMHIPEGKKWKHIVIFLLWQLPFILSVKPTATVCEKFVLNYAENVWNVASFFWYYADSWQLMLRKWGHIWRLFLAGYCKHFFARDVTPTAAANVFLNLLANFCLFIHNYGIINDFIGVIILNKSVEPSQMNGK